MLAENYVNVVAGSNEPGYICYLKIVLKQIKQSKRDTHVARHKKLLHIQIIEILFTVVGVGKRIIRKIHHVLFLE